MNPVDPDAGHVAQSSKVGFGSSPFNLEPSHLAGRGSHPIGAPTIDGGSHDGVARKMLGIVDILLAGPAPVDRLSRQAGNRSRLFRPRRRPDGTLPATSISSSVSPSSRHASRLESKGFLLPGSSSFRRQSKWTRKGAGIASTIGPTMIAPPR